MALSNLAEVRMQAKMLLGYCHHFTAVIMATGIAHMMRALQFAAIWAFLKRGDAQRIVAAAHIAL